VRENRDHCAGNLALSIWQSGAALAFPRAQFIQQMLELGRRTERLRPQAHLEQLAHRIADRSLVLPSIGSDLSTTRPFMAGSAALVSGFKPSRCSGIGFTSGEEGMPSSSNMCETDRRSAKESPGRAGLLASRSVAAVDQPPAGPQGVGTNRRA